MISTVSTRRVAEMIVNAIDGAEVLNPDVAKVTSSTWRHTADAARVTIHLTDGSAWVADVYRAAGLDTISST